MVFSSTSPHRPETGQLPLFSGRGILFPLLLQTDFQCRAIFLHFRQRAHLLVPGMRGTDIYPGKNPVTVVSDISGHSTCIGEYVQFVQYFRDRYSRLSEIIRGRVNARPMESLKRRSFRRGGRRRF